MLREPIWERQAGEPKRPWQLFSAFRDMGQGRTITALYRRTTGRQQARQPSGTWNNWAVVWRWHERAAAWDRHMDAVQREHEEAEAREQAARQAQLRAAQRDR